MAFRDDLYQTDGLVGLFPDHTRCTYVHRIFLLQNRFIVDSRGHISQTHHHSILVRVEDTELRLSKTLVLVQAFRPPQRISTPLSGSSCDFWLRPLLSRASVHVQASRPPHRTSAMAFRDDLYQTDGRVGPFPDHSRFA